MKANIVIRPATLADVPALRAVAIDTQWATFGPHNTREDMEAFLEESYTLEKLSAELDEPETIYYLAWDGDTLAGFARLRRTHEVDEYLGDNHLELQRLYVAVGAQGKGIGQQLMDVCLRYATDHGFEYLWLGVWERNFNAQRFYAKYGFEQFSTHVFQMGSDPQTDWLLKKQLKG